MHSDSSVIKDQSGKALTVKQGATTIHEDCAALKDLNLPLDNGSGSSHI